MGIYHDVVATGRYKRFLVYSFSFSLGLIAALSSILVLYSEEKNRFLDVPYREVTKFWGSIGGDSRYREDKNLTSFIVDVKGVEVNKNEYVDHVREKILVQLKGKYFFYKGERVTISAPISDRYGWGLKNLADFIVYSDIKYIKLSGFDSFWSRLRFKVINLLNRRIDRIGYPASELFRALFLGFKGGLNYDFVDTFRRSGTIHVLALSGLHVGIIFLIISFVLIPFGHPLGRFGLSTLLIFVYLFVTGFSASLVRAGLMVFFFGICKIIDRDVNPINILSLAAIVILLFSPLSLFSLSFQLSFLAVLGIVLLGNWAANSLEKRIPRFILIPISFGVGAQFAVSPVLVMNFGMIYPVGIIASIFVVPLVTLYLWVGIPFILMPDFVFNVLLGPVSVLLDFLHYLILLINEFFSSLPGVKIESMRGVFALVWGGVFVAIIIFLKVERRVISDEL